MFITILYIRCLCARAARVEEVANDNQLKTKCVQNKGKGKTSNKKGKSRGDEKGNRAKRKQRR